MPVNPRLVRSYDLRGKVGRDLGDGDAHALGLAYAAGQPTGARIAVGYDGRLSSPALEAALVAGLVAGGMHVERIGCGPTGMLYHAVHSGGLDGGIMVTGSHNPPDENGFKLLCGIEPIFGPELAALVTQAPALHPGGRAGSRPVRDDYLATLAAAARDAPALRIGWDPGHGATAEIVAALARRLPGTHVLMNATIDGRFPAHHPDPSDPANLAPLQTCVSEQKLDLGIAFDGDGDRIGVIGPDGRIIWPDQLMLFLARDLLARLPGASIVADVKSSRALFDGIARAGGRAVMAPSGYVLIRERMFRQDAPFGGEMSGHIFFRDGWTGTDDAIHVAMRLLSALGRADLRAFLATLPATVATPELRLPCPDDAKAPILAAVADGLAGAQVDRTDGVRVDVEDGWWLLRASGTEAKLTARIEADNAAALARLRAELFDRLTAAGWCA